MYFQGLTNTWSNLEVPEGSVTMRISLSSQICLHIKIGKFVILIEDLF